MTKTTNDTGKKKIAGTANKKIAGATKTICGAARKKERKEQQRQEDMWRRVG